jgi:hypothetical protein
MAPPAGTFLAKVRSGAIQFPQPLKAYCEAEGWDLFRVVSGDRDRLSLEPILKEGKSESDESEAGLTESYCSSLSADGRLWIPAELRESVALMEQSVMMRIENRTIGVYLRKVFDTLGFRP